MVVFMTIVGFAAGSLPLSLWLGRLALGVDIREYGPDRNPGAGNVWRAGGPALGVAAAALDIAKAAVPIAVARLVLGVSGWALLPVALAPILGHDFSPLLRFRGGKGVAATFGAWLALAGPLAMLALAVCFGRLLRPALPRRLDRPRRGDAVLGAARGDWRRARHGRDRDRLPRSPDLHEPSRAARGAAPTAPQPLSAQRPLRPEL